MRIFSEHTSNDNSSDDTRSIQGPRGPPGQRGIGFNLTSNGNYDLKDKKCSIFILRMTTELMTIITITYTISNQLLIKSI